MNDRYLFKAKRIDNEKWYKWNAIVGLNMVTPINRETICQCTGLKDKNGNLIWENDIVAYWDTYNTESGMSESDCIGEVVWEEETLSFEVANRLSAESYEVLEDCSVIGNKFDNPELLESEE